MVVVGEEAALRKKLTPRAGFPDLHRRIVAGRGDASATGRPRYSIYPGSMIAMCEDIASAGCVPYLYRVVPRARGDASAIGRPGHGAHLIGMTGIGEDMNPIPILRGLPYLHC